MFLLGVDAVKESFMGLSVTKIILFLIGVAFYREGGCGRCLEMSLVESLGHDMKWPRLMAVMFMVWEHLLSVMWIVGAAPFWSRCSWNVVQAVVIYRACCFLRSWT